MTQEHHNHEPDIKAWTPLFKIQESHSQGHIVSRCQGQISNIVL